MKTEFTKQERNEIYNRLLKEVYEANHDYYYLCWSFANAMGVNYGPDLEDAVLDAFPEFKEIYLPLYENELWNYTMEERRNVITECIKLTA